MKTFLNLSFPIGPFLKLNYDILTYWNEYQGILKNGSCSMTVTKYHKSKTGYKVWKV